MHIHTRIRRNGTWTERGSERRAAQLVLVFSSRLQLSNRENWQQLRAFYTHARIVACSTAGEIEDVTVHEDSMVCTGLHFERSSVAVASVAVKDTQSERLGEALASKLTTENLVHVFVLSDGSAVNGSALLKGMTNNLPHGVAVTGGLAGDGSHFKATAVCVDDGNTLDQIVAIGFYGQHLTVGYGSEGGWDPFGVERKVTKSLSNVLYELDGAPALDLYKKYLGPQADRLPASALRFPLAIRAAGAPSEKPLVRTILSIDEGRKSMTFAGDIPIGWRARLMSANVEHLLDGANNAALAARSGTVAPPDIAILVSCVGRKLVLAQRVEEEVEAVRNAIGATTQISGFYSYGELSPFVAGGRSEFHNQTMTITTISER